jgi:hypothetical protein
MGVRWTRGSEKSKGEKQETKEGKQVSKYIN